MNNKRNTTTDKPGLTQITDLEKFNPLTEKIIGCAYTVSNSLGSGFLEKVYENALAYEIRKAGLKVAQQQRIQVWYDGIIVGEFFSDLWIEESVIVELKTVKALDNIHQAQCINYLKATGLHICLLLNFGSPRIEIKRLVV